MSKYEIRKRDNSVCGHGDWALVEYMGNARIGHWVEVVQGSHECCVKFRASLTNERVTV